jgi:hypothetical protein
MRKRLANQEDHGYSIFVNVRTRHVRWRGPRPWHSAVLGLEGGIFEAVLEGAGHSTILEARLACSVFVRLRIWYRARCVFVRAQQSVVLYI